ncbi:MAG: lipocalin family protein [Fibromonadaceae bacterium]|jgi:hypothetical protein|nr:lipocalin family protein [Fibromonadaceae bacterium]
MVKFFFSRNRFLALCACASLFSLLFACSDDKKSSENRLEHCENGNVAGCLIGQWRLEQIEDDDWANPVDEDASGTLIFKEDLTYSFDGSTIGKTSSHEGHWALSADGKSISITCTNGGSVGCVAKATEKIELTTNWSILKIFGSPFLNSRNPMAPNQFEKYSIAP